MRIAPTLTFALLAPLLIPASTIAQDSAEPNNTRQMAADLGTGANVTTVTRSNLTFHSMDDEDWFTFEAPVDGAFRITLIPDQAAGQSIFIEIYKGDSPDLITGAVEVTMPEVFELNVAAGESLTAKIRASSTSTSAGSYTIDVFFFDPSTFPGWLAEWDLPHTLSWNADPDGNGIPLSIEFALGYRPGYFNQANQSRPIHMSWVNSFTLRATLATNNTGSRTPIAIEKSTDLKTWTLVDAEHLSIAANPIPEGTIGFTVIEIPREEIGTQLYFRLRATEPAP